MLSLRYVCLFCLELTTLNVCFNTHFFVYIYAAYPVSYPVIILIFVIPITCLTAFYCLRLYHTWGDYSSTTLALTFSFSSLPHAIDKRIESSGIRHDLIVIFVFINFLIFFMEELHIFAVSNEIEDH